MSTCRVSLQRYLGRIDAVLVEEILISYYGLVDWSGPFCFRSERVVQCKDGDRDTSGSRNLGKAQETRQRCCRMTSLVATTVKVVDDQVAILCVFRVSRSTLANPVSSKFGSQYSLIQFVFDVGETSRFLESSLGILAKRAHYT